MRLAKLKVMLGALLIGLMMQTSVFADEVFVTQHGAKYHKATCRLVKNKTSTALEKEAAIEKSYTPCRRCYKEDVVIEEVISENTGEAAPTEVVPE